MNSNVHPLVVALVLVFTGIAIGIWTWASGAAASIGGPAGLKMDPAGHAYIQIQDKLVEHGPDGRYLETHDLSDMGVELFLGGFDFFSNGDVLLRRGPDPRSTGDNIRAFQRKTNDQTIEADSPNSGMFRCDLDTRDCTRFGQTGIDFKAAYGVFIDRTTNDVFISDTTRHLLRKYSSDGVALADPVSGFKFPNQALVHDGKLFVADTNHHEIRIVNPATESYGNELGRKDVTPQLATAAGHDWPSHFIRVGDGWWVNNMRTGMNQGGIYLFDDRWRLVRKLDLPDNADPIALLAFGDEVWISDWNNDKVHRISSTGEPLSDLESAGLEEILTLARSERQKFEMISYSGIALILLVLGGLAVRGFAVSMSTDPAKSTRDDRRSEIQSPEPVLTLEPDNKMLGRMKLAVRFLILMSFVLAVSIACLIFFYAKPEFGIALILPGMGMLSIVALIGWINRSNVGTAIRVNGNLVTLRDHTGRESTCPLHEVRYDDTAIATPDSMVFLGRPGTSVYKREDLNDKLFPRLADAQKLSPLQMQKLLIEQQHPQGITIILGLAALLIYAVWTLTK